MVRATVKDSETSTLKDVWHIKPLTIVKATMAQASVASSRNMKTYIKLMTTA